MHRDEILKYIESKNNYKQNDYKFNFIFEVFYIPGNREIYKKKLYNMERKLEEEVRMHTPYKIKNFLSKALKNTFKSTHQSGKSLIQ